MLGALSVSYEGLGETEVAYFEFAGQWIDEDVFGLDVTVD